MRELIGSVMVSSLLLPTFGTLSLPLYFRLPSTFLPSKGRSITTLGTRWHDFFITLFKYFINLFYSFHCLSFPFLTGCRLEKGHIVPVLCSHSIKKKKKSIRKTCQLDGESETVLMAHVADLIRRLDIFSHEYPLFDGSFTVNCQQRSVPQSLLTLMSMILYGSNIKNKNNYQLQTAMSVSQLLVYNSVCNLKSNPTDNRHSKSRELPLPLFD